MNQVLLLLTKRKDKGAPKSHFKKHRLHYRNSEQFAMIFEHTEEVTDLFSCGYLLS